jgi:hypothetical protein
MTNVTFAFHVVILYHPMLPIAHCHHHHFYYSLTSVQFKEMASAITESVHKNVEALPDVYGTMSESLTSYAINSNLTWPYVTSRALTKTVACTFSAVVTDPIGWMDYSAKHAGEAASPVIFQIVNYTIVPVFTPGYYVVSWLFDVELIKKKGDEDAFVNYDMMSGEGYKERSEAVSELRKGLIAGFIQQPEVSKENILAITKDIPPGVKFNPENMNAILAAAFPESDPQSSFTIPVFESFENDSKTVGYIEGFMRWSQYFLSSLLKKDLGVYCVISHSAGQAHTWFAEKDKVTYLGHVSRYNSDVGGNVCENAWSIFCVLAYLLSS